MSLGVFEWLRMKMLENGLEEWEDCDLPVRWLPEWRSLSESGSDTSRGLPCLDFDLDDLNDLIFNHDDDDMQDGPSTKKTLTTKGWSMEFLLAQGDNFEQVPRVSALELDMDRISDYNDIDTPLVIEGWHNHPKWPKDLFTIDKFRELSKDSTLDVRNIHTLKDRNVPLDDFIERSRASEPFVGPQERERWYGKDAECPEEWRQWLHSGVIPSIFTPDHPDNYLNYLPPENQVETLMCYHGIGDTFTPAHKDLCASSGHNLMCYTERDGCSFWFMTRGSDILKVTRYFQRLRHELDHELHTITIEELAKAPFTVYVTQQKLGDLVLVPPRSCHQVVNYGGITTKTSWSRMTLKGLSVALYHELPVYQRVCRVETYRIKLTIYHSLCALVDSIASDGSMTRNDAQRLQTLLEMFDHILKMEAPHPIVKPKRLHTLTDNLSCDFCGADIFQSFLECSKCAPPGKDSAADEGIVLCPGCYAEGRRCRCFCSEPTECRDFQDLLDRRQQAFDTLNAYHKMCKLGVLDVEDAITLDGKDCVFYAACILWKECTDIKKLKTPEERSCRYSPKTLSHVAIRSHVISCRGCHAGKCFPHQLEEWNLHSTQSLIAYASSTKGSIEYHALHQETRVTCLKTAFASVERSVSEGTAISYTSLAIYLCTRFKCCRPMNQDYTKPGWYDKRLREIPYSDEPSETSGTVDETEMDVAEDTGSGHTPAVVSDPPPAPTQNKPAKQVFVVVPTTKSLGIKLPVKPPSRKRKRTVYNEISSSSEEDDIPLARLIAPRGSRTRPLPSTSKAPVPPLPAVSQGNINKSKPIGTPKKQYQSNAARKAIDTAKQAALNDESHQSIIGWGDTSSHVNRQKRPRSPDPTEMVSGLGEASAKSSPRRRTPSPDVPQPPETPTRYRNRFGHLTIPKKSAPLPSSPVESFSSSDSTDPLSLFPSAEPSYESLSPRKPLPPQTSTLNVTPNASPPGSRVFNTHGPQQHSQKNFGNQAWQRTAINYDRHYKKRRRYQDQSTIPHAGPSTSAPEPDDRSYMKGVLYERLPESKILDDGAYPVHPAYSTNVNEFTVPSPMPPRPYAKDAEEFKVPISLTIPASSKASASAKSSANVKSSASAKASANAKAKVKAKAQVRVGSPVTSKVYENFWDVPVDYGDDEVA